MKKIKLLALSAVACAGSIVISGYHGGAAAAGGYDCTGAETGLGNFAGCGTTSGGCHSNTPTANIAVTVELDSTGGKKTKYYVPGAKYTIKIVGKNNGTTNQPGFGFQLGVIKGSAAVTTPTNEGTFNSPYPSTTQYTPANATYYVLNVVEHSNNISCTSGTGGNGSTYQEVINWTAPAKGTGTISIWGVVNAVNNNGTNDKGDLWNTANTALTEITPTGVNEVAATDNEINVYPNPFTVKTTFSLSNEVNNGIVYLYDLTGKEVQKVNFSGKEVSLDRNSLPSGIYFYNIVSDNQSIKTGKIIAQ